MFVAVRSAYTVGPAFWRKRGGDFGDGGAEMFKHVADHWVGLNQQAIRLNLAGRVAVADMPGEAGEAGGLLSPPLAPRPCPRPGPGQCSGDAPRQCSGGPRCRWR